MPCPAHAHVPRPTPAGVKPPEVGKMGVIKLKRVIDDPRDVYGEVTHAKYAFSTRTVLYVYMQDAVYLLGKDYILG
jgi:hypothetical protein